MPSPRHEPPVTAAHSLAPVFTTAQAGASGLSRHTQQTRVRNGTWRRLRSGVFCHAATWDAADPGQRLLLTALAAQCCWRGAVVSHLAAAAAHDLWLPPGALGLPWLTVDSLAGRPLGLSVVGGRAPARRTDDVRVEAAALVPQDVVDLRRRAARVTSLARTTADCLRHLDAADAVPIADSAARAGLSRDALVEVLQRQVSWPYAQRAEAALPLLDPRRETWIESRAAVVMWRRGIPLFEPQAVVRDELGRFVARVDGWWPELGLFLEVDGWAKYRAAGPLDAAAAERALRVEKEREDRLRDLGGEIVRASTDVVLDGDALVDRFHRARQRADRTRLRGTITPMPWPPMWPSTWAPFWSAR